MRLTSVLLLKWSPYSGLLPRYRNGGRKRVEEEGKRGGEGREGEGRKGRGGEGRGGEKGEGTHVVECSSLLLMFQDETSCHECSKVLSSKSASVEPDGELP